MQIPRVIPMQRAITQTDLISAYVIPVIVEMDSTALVRLQKQLLVYNE